MKKYKSLLAVLLAGTMVFTTVPAQPVYATTDDIIIVQPDEDQDIVTPVSDVDIVTDIPEDHLINDEEAEDNTLSTDTWCLSLLTICEQLFESIDRFLFTMYNP